MKRSALAFVLFLGAVFSAAPAVAEPIPGLDRYVVLTPSQDDVDLLEVLPTLFPDEFFILRRYRTPLMRVHPAYMAVLTTPLIAQIINERYGYLGINVEVDKQKRRTSLPLWQAHGGGALGSAYGDSALWGQIRVQALQRPVGIAVPASNTPRDRGARVCLIDSGAHTGIFESGAGANPGHPAISGKALAGWNFGYTPILSVSDVATGRVTVCKNQSNTSRCYQDDVDPHGTLVAGIIAGRDLGTPASGGSVGVAPPNTMLLVARAFDNFYRWNPAISDFDIINTMFSTDEAAALYWCAGADLNVPPTSYDYDPTAPLIPVLGNDYKAQVVNMSFGGSPDSMEHDAIAYGVSRGLIFVAAAGNQRYSDDPVNALDFPAAYSEVVAVTAIGPDDKIPSWALRTSRAVAAPGVGIVGPTSTDGAGSAAYDSYDGTSFSAPFVTGAVAAMLTELPYGGIDDIRFTFSETTGLNVLNMELTCRR